MRRRPRLRSIALLGAAFSLVFAAPAVPGDPCAGQPDGDGDGLCDIVDNCSAVPNASQSDGDQDGYGDVCDCDFSTSAANACDGGDFGNFAGHFGSGVPPTNCEFDMAPNGAIDGGDFAVFASMFGGLPGPACGNAPGTPCATPGAPCFGGFFETIEVVGPVSR